MTCDAREPALPTDPIKEATVQALRRMLDPMLDLLFDAGVTLPEFNHVARDRAVHVAARRLEKDSGRLSKSRVAIMTGIPRTEVTRILRATPTADAKPVQHPARRVLNAWHDDARFLTAKGTPAVLPIFGGRRSFEVLVKKFGAGIPVRAMLDELIQLGAVERLANQRLKAIARVPIVTGLNSRAITAIGERVGDLLATLTHNVRNGIEPYFEATALIDDGDKEQISLARRDLTQQSTNFIDGATSILNRSRIPRWQRQVRAPPACRVGVTVYYFQEDLQIDIDTPPGKIGRRKNLQRKIKKSAAQCDLTRRSKAYVANKHD